MLDRFVEQDGAEMRLTINVVQAPIVGIVDNLVLGNGLERQRGMLGHEAQDPRTILTGRIGCAGKILRVHLEQPRNIDATRVMVDPAIPFTAEKLPGGVTQGLAQSLAFERGRAHRRASVRPTIDCEMDTRFGEMPAQNLMLDIVKAHRSPASDMPAPLKELAVARLPYRANRILVYDRAEGEGVVGVEPVSQFVLFGWKGAGVVVGPAFAKLGDYPLESIAAFEQPQIVNLPAVGYHLRQQPGQLFVAHPFTSEQCAQSLDRPQWRCQPVSVVSGRLRAKINHLLKAARFNFTTK